MPFAPKPFLLKAYNHTTFVCSHRSVSTVFKCQLVGGSAVVVKQYHKAKMQDKHFHKLAREVEAMRALLQQAQHQKQQQQQQHRGSGSGAAESSSTSSSVGGSGSGAGAVESRPQTPSSAACVCPGVVQLNDTFEDSASIYLVMECCEGEPRGGCLRAAGFWVRGEDGGRDGPCKWETRAVMTFLLCMKARRWAC